MDGLECCEIKYSEINNEFRIDSEYFQKIYINYEKIIRNKSVTKIGSIATVTDGIHTSIDYDNTSDINLISATSPRFNIFNLSRQAKISKEAHNKNSRTALHKGDIILSTVGTIGNCAVVDESILPANSDRHVGILRTNQYKPNFISSFILSKYGRFQTKREITGNVQPNLFIYKIREIVIPILTENFQNLIENTVIYAKSLLNNSTEKYDIANKILLKEINFDISKLSNKGTTTKQLSESFGRSGRLDAEYYQPKYDDLYNLLNKITTKQLKSIVDITKSIEPGSEYYCDEGIPFIRVSDVNTMGISNPTIKIPNNIIPSIETLYPKKDTILFSKDGSVGIAYKIEENIEAITSGALLHFNVINKDEILPDYITLVLNSDIVQLQAERDSSGAIIQHWKPSDIANIIIPILPYDIQLEISQKVQESFALRRKSEKLIKTAVKAVEIAIEKDESTAIDYIKENTK